MTEDSTDGGRSRFEEALAEVLWLESCGWRLAVDGSWSHPRQAPDAAFTQSQAFAVEARRGGVPDESA